MHYDTIFSGFGGQGVLLIGDIVAHSAMLESNNVTYLPSYGVEMRGGTVNCIIIISKNNIGSPVTGRPNSAIVMNQESLIKYQPIIRSSGLLMVNTNFIKENENYRDDIDKILIPASDLAKEIGSDKMANMVLLGAFIEKTKVVKVNTLFDCLNDIFPEKYKDKIPLNIKAIEAGINFIKNIIQSMSFPRKWESQ